MSTNEDTISVGHHRSLQKNGVTENKHLNLLETKESQKKDKDDQQMHSSINEQSPKHDKHHDVKMQRLKKASIISKAKNVLAENDNDNKSLMCSVAQLKDHAPSDVKSQRHRKTSNITKSQNVLVQNESKNKSKVPSKTQLNDHTPSGRMLKKHDATENRHL
eukprot:8556150-Ditylum_brightwellii.AAC.1